MKQTGICSWHSMYNDWLRALDFYKGEINILRTRLNNINTTGDILKRSGHFEHQFILHIDNIDRLQHSIRESISIAAKEVVYHDEFRTTDFLQRSEVQKNQFILEERLVHELRHAFNRFCTERM